MLADDVPLLRVKVLMFVVAPVPPKVLFVAPVKVMPAAAALGLVLKFNVPLLVRLPPTDRICVVTVVPVWKIPPLSIVTWAVIFLVWAVSFLLPKAPTLLMVTPYA